MRRNGNLTLKIYILYTVKSVYIGHPWDSKKVAVVKRWSVLTVCSYKIAINFGKLEIRLVIVDRWPLFRGGGLTVIPNYV
jgi:hypothetical protein